MKTLIIIIVIMMAAPAAATQYIIDDVDPLLWTYGCMPTAAAMLINHWDSKPGYTDLVDDTTTDNELMRYLSLTMETSPAGATYLSKVKPGLSQYITWDNPHTAADESFMSDVTYRSVNVSLDWDRYTASIESDRPVILNWFNNGGPGHSTLAIGYDDVTRRVATYTTWTDKMDWWYFDRDMGGYNIQSLALHSGVFVDIDPRLEIDPVPEPSTMVLVGIGLIVLGVYIRASKPMVK